MSTNVSPLALQPGQFGPGEAAAEPDQRIRVLIADDHAAVLAGVRRLLDEQPDMRIITEATNAIGAVTGTAAASDVAVIDYHLGDRNGLWVTPPSGPARSAAAGPDLLRVHRRRARDRRCRGRR